MALMSFVTSYGSAQIDATGQAFETFLDWNYFVGAIVGFGVVLLYTTFGGFLPLILEGGGFWPPFAMAIAGGVLLSTVVSFFYVPPMFMLVYRRKHKRAQSRMLEESPAATATLTTLRSDAA